MPKYKWIIQGIHLGTHIYKINHCQHVLLHSHTANKYGSIYNYLYAVMHTVKYMYMYIYRNAMKISIPTNLTKTMEWKFPGFTRGSGGSVCRNGMDIFHSISSS